MNGGRAGVRRVPVMSAVVLAVALAVAVVLRSAAAQVLPPAPPEMQTLSWLQGDWAGSGWMEYQPGRRAEFEGTESVVYRMGRRLLVVEGQFTARMGAGEVPVHQALGVISWDGRNGRYLFRTYTAAGGQGDANEPEVSEGRMVWSYDDPRRGRVRYTITRTEDGAWHEIGEASGDGGVTWRQFFEMTLEKGGG